MGVALSWLTAPHLKRSLEPADFFSSLAEPAPTPRKQSPEEMIAVLKSVVPKPPKDP